MKSAVGKLTIRLALLLPLATGLLATTLPASAALTPFQQVPVEQPDVTALHTGPAAAMLERVYFQAPQQPVATRTPGPCTVQTVVFDKARLARSCY